MFYLTIVNILLYCKNKYNNYNNITKIKLSPVLLFSKCISNILS